ncbi:MAG: 16S rRNA (adenine(1518)-N(6)/adenine(1519)-N(6))-dimethyltransferase, partial [Bacteroidota bacterium]
TSAVIRLSRRENQDLQCSPKLFKTVVKQAFSQRRKMLRNTMKPFLPGSEQLQTPFFQQRPERLSVDDFVQLTNWIAEYQEE